MSEKIFLLSLFGFIMFCGILTIIIILNVSRLWKKKCKQMQIEINDFKILKKEMRELILIKELNL